MLSCRNEVFLLEQIDVDEWNDSNSLLISEQLLTLADLAQYRLQFE